MSWATFHHRGHGDHLIYPTASLIAHHRPLDAVVEAFALADGKRSRALKVIVEP